MRAILICREPSRAVRTIATLALLATVVAGCSDDDGPAGEDGRVTVVASFYPLAEAAARVGGERVDVMNLTPAGVEPHDLELTPDSLEAVAMADVVLFAGGGFQPAIEEAVGQATGATVDALEGVADLPPPEEVEEDGHEGEVVGADPHAWLDPSRYAAIVSRVAAALSEASPEDASRFAEAAEVFAAELTDLDQEFRGGLERCESRLLIVNHAAFGYLADAYDLHQEGITGVSPDAEPDPRRLAELRDLVETEGVTTIFTEELVSPAVAETLASEAGVTTAVLNPLEGLTAEQGSAGEDYRSVMRSNLEALRDGLRCD